MKNCLKLNFNPKKPLFCAQVHRWRVAVWPIGRQFIMSLIPFSFTLKLYLKNVVVTRIWASSTARVGSNECHMPLRYDKHTNWVKNELLWQVLNVSHFLSLVCVYERRHAGHYEVRWTGRMWKLRATRIEWRIGLILRYFSKLKDLIDVLKLKQILML